MLRRWSEPLPAQQGARRADCARGRQRCVAGHQLPAVGDFRSARQFHQPFRRTAPAGAVVFPLACASARMQPVHVDDVAQAFVLALDRHETFGKRYNLCGPQVYSLREIVTYLAVSSDSSGTSCRSMTRFRICRPPFCSLPQASRLPRQLPLATASECLRGILPGIFGITPGRFDEIVPTYISRVNS